MNGMNPDNRTFQSFRVSIANSALIYSSFLGFFQANKLKLSEQFYFQAKIRKCFDLNFARCYSIAESKKIFFKNSF